ncbi:hypothetical protein QWY86_00100 [Pedobacter aquatilis]|uniref:hypothetical protein n=1 Tax=Pedobacter aquatilis TaxID=351343 RepID=UPI0025B34B91|nr:hypothetical protein [Pedobacter aquatilis]MDN3585055.1 hypothetical protein [Pedobacter aquatilis]
MAGVYRSGLYRSDDKGINWSLIGFDKNVYLYSIIQNIENQLFLTAAFIGEGNNNNIATGVFKSDDDGRSWSQTSFKKLDPINLSQTSKGILIVSTKKASYISKNKGKNWLLAGKGLPTHIPISGVVEFNNLLFASLGDRQEESGKVRGGIYFSRDDGLTWYRSDKGIDTNSPISSILLQDTSLYASAGYEQINGEVGVYKSVDKGKTWVMEELNGQICRFIMRIKSGQLVVGTNGRSLYFSDKIGNKFSQVGNGIDNWETFRITGGTSNIFASGNGIWKFSLSSKHWKLIRKDGGTDVATTSNGNLLIFEKNKILISDDEGKTWRGVKDIKGDYAIFKHLSEKIIVVSISNNGTWSSIDNGKTWKKYILNGYTNFSTRTAALNSQQTLIISGNNGSPFTLRSKNKSTFFKRVKSLDSLEIWDFATTKDVIYAGTYAHGVYKSIDDGLTWSATNNGLKVKNEYVTVTSITPINFKIIICTTLDKGIFITKDGGKNWNPYTEGLKDENFWTLFYDPFKRIIYTACPSGIYKRKIQ